MAEENSNKSKKFNQPIIYTRGLSDSTLAVVDAKTNIRFLNKKNLKLLNGFSVGITRLWYKNATFSFSKDGKYFATISGNAKESKLYNVQTKKLIAKVNRHKGDVTCVGIDKRAKYFFSCGDDGRTFVVDIKSSKLSFTLPAHYDEINDIVFSKNNQLVATASYDKQISIFDFSMMIPIVKLKAHAAPVMKILFLNEHRLFSVDKNGGAIIWDLNTKKVITRLTGVHDTVREVTANDKFLFLGTQLGFVMVYELEGYTQINRNFLKYNSPISSLDFDDVANELVIGCESGELHLCDIYDGEKHLEELLKRKGYDEIQYYVDKHPILSYTKPYKIMLDIWTNSLQEAEELLQLAKQNEAKTILSKFNSPSRQTIIKKLFKEYDEFAKFITLIKKDKLSLAYSLVKKHKSYQKSKLYIALEKRWKKLFAKAQKMAIQAKSKDEILELLSPYRGVSEKTILIQEMIVKSKVYVRFKDAVSKKDFKIAFELARVNPYLKEFEDYNSLIAYGDELYIKISKLLKESDLHNSIKLLRILIDFPDFEDEAKRMILDIENRGKFFKAVDENDLKTAYNLLSKSDILGETNEGKKLIEKWESDLELAEEYAIKADIISIDGVLDDYKNISSKNMAIVNIYAWAYINQIEQAIAKNRKKEIIEKAFKTYILNFGIDDHIYSTFELFEKKYSKSKLVLDALKKGSRAMWRVSMRVINILE